MVLRVLFATFPVWSLGLLSWVPSLRFALLGRRRLDWLVFGLFTALTVGYLVLLGTVPSDPEGDNPASLLAGAYAILFIGGSLVHGLLGEPRPAAGRVGAVPPPTVRGPGGYGYPQTAPDATGYQTGSYDTGAYQTGAQQTGYQDGGYQTGGQHHGGYQQPAQPPQPTALDETSLFDTSMIDMEQLRRYEQGR
ncbi:hypothetical protein [Streptomyces alkaliterrae]|uniref:Uncharacterized protein n=1 Tax=Streptomyces alkaliterrae TaxID=2213162 RepID=A0A7W3WRN2_9ACTN|nr:hypothetical protein [Streptomyces alkaliterrae]MBB1257273.1 hypothetical protein [Streptomyces alkaliterrae]